MPQLAHVASCAWWIRERVVAQVVHQNCFAIYFIFCPPFALQRSNKNHWLLWIKIYPYALILLLNFHFFLSFVRRFSCILILLLSFLLFQLNLLLIKKRKRKNLPPYFFYKEDWFPQSNQIKTPYSTLLVILTLWDQRSQHLVSKQCILQIMTKTRFTSLLNKAIAHLKKTSDLHAHDIEISKKSRNSTALYCRSWLMLKEEDNHYKLLCYWQFGSKQNSIYYSTGVYQTWVSKIQGWRDCLLGL